MTRPARAAALAAELSRTRIITPTLTDDAATLTVTLDEAAILAALEETRRDAIEEAAIRAGAHPTKTLGGHLEMLLAQRVCVEIAISIRALLDPPDSKRPGTPEDDGSDET